MGDVVTLDVVTRLDIPVERVMDAAKEAGLTAIVICGYDADGEEYFASSYADGSNMLWLLERAKMKLFQVTDDLAK